MVLFNETTPNGVLKWVIITSEGETVRSPSGQKYFDSEGCAIDALRELLGDGYEEEHKDYLIIDIDVS